MQKSRRKSQDAKIEVENWRVAACGRQSVLKTDMPGEQPVGSTPMPSVLVFESGELAER